MPPNRQTAIAGATSFLLAPSDTTPHFDCSQVLRGPGAPEPYFATKLGALYGLDCMELLPWIKDGAVDTVFADPPFNLGKRYRSSTDDNRTEGGYLDWCRAWLAECVRITKPGGALFLYNLPQWNITLGNFLLEQGLQFRHWIAVAMSSSPAPARQLHRSHNGLLYFTKGEPNTFQRIRTPFLRCRHCGKELKNYGNRRQQMDPRGVALKDVWTDIPLVQKGQHKSPNRHANALSTKLLDRVVEMSTLPGDIVFDPFGGSGTTYAVCESKGRHWLGTDIDYADDIAARLAGTHILPHPNSDIVCGG